MVDVAGACIAIGGSIVVDTLRGCVMPLQDLFYSYAVISNELPSSYIFSIPFGLCKLLSY